MRNRTPPPDPNIGIAQREMTDLARNEQSFFQNNFAPRLLTAMDQQVALGNRQAGLQEDLQNFQMGLARRYDDRYWDTTARFQDDFYDQVRGFNQESERERIAGQAGADVAQSFGARDQALQRGMMRMGVNPGSAAFQSAARTSSNQEALARAGAMTAARQAAKDLGLRYTAAAAGLGGEMLQATQGALGLAGASGVNALNAGASGLGAINTTAGGFNANTRAVGSLWNNVGNLGVQNYNAQVNASNSGRGGGLAAMAGGLFQGIGMAGGFGSFFSSKDLKTRGAPVDGAKVLEQYKGLPNEHWEYIPGAGDGGAHGGPYSEDVQRRFGDRAAPGGKMINADEMGRNNGMAIRELTRKLGRIERDIKRLGG